MHIIQFRASGRRIASTVALAGLVAVSVSVGAPAHARPTGPTVAQRAAAGSAQVYAALQRDLGLTAAQAQQLGSTQAKALQTDRTLRGSLGSA
jgi:streptogrisin C